MFKYDAYSFNGEWYQRLIRPKHSTREAAESARDFDLSLGFKCYSVEECAADTVEETAHIR